MLGHLDQHARTFIEAAPFVLVGTASPDGTGDVSPKGGPPGFVVVCAVQDRRPKAAIGVTVTQQYMHCAKAFRRSELWNPQTWPDRSTLPSLGCIVRDQIATLRETPAEKIDASLEADYAASLWEPGGKR